MTLTPSMRPSCSARSQSTLMRRGRPRDRSATVCMAAASNRTELAPPATPSRCWMYPGMSSGGSACSSTRRVMRSFSASSPSALIVCCSPGCPQSTTWSSFCPWYSRPVSMRTWSSTAGVSDCASSSTSTAWLPSGTSARRNPSSVSSSCATSAAASPPRRSSSCETRPKSRSTMRRTSAPVMYGLRMMAENVRSPSACSTARQSVVLPVPVSPVSISRLSRRRRPLSSSVNARWCDALR